MNSDSLTSRVEKRGLFPDSLNYISALPPSDADTQPLWDLIQWLATGPSVVEQLDAFENFISAHPESAWTPSLRSNLATYYAKRGRFSLALAHWEAAWPALRDKNTSGAKAVGDYVLGNWTELLAALGQLERLNEIVTETQGRLLDGGPWQVRYNRSVEALATQTRINKGTKSGSRSMLLVCARDFYDCRPERHKSLEIKKLDGDSTYLNKICDSWLGYEPVGRNQTDIETFVSMWLKEEMEIKRFT